MKKYILLFFVLSILFFPSVLGKEVTIEMAKTVAIKFLEERNLEFNSMLISNPIIVQKESISTYYTFKFENGFIIISADNSVFPVLGYSFESNFFENNIPPAFSFWMNQLSEQILFNIQMEAKAPRKYIQIVGKISKWKFCSH